MQQRISRKKLGGGGFGSVFKGTLPDSSVIAVKKLNCGSQDASKVYEVKYYKNLLVILLLIIRSLSCVFGIILGGFS